MYSISFKRIPPAHPALQYMGRIDETDVDSPVFVYPCSWAQICFRGTAIKMDVTNLHSFYENALGVILDGVQSKLILPDSGRAELTVAEGLPNGIHELTIFKRMDACHYFRFHGFLLPEGGEVLPLPEKPARRMEFFGDSVTAGEVSEALDYCAKADPAHNGEFSNSYYSYAWITARKLNAQIHDTAQGGVALLDGTGYFCAPDLIGMEHLYDRIQCNPYLGETKQWDFRKYIPHVVVVAIGQNDAHPDNYMERGLDEPKAENWMNHYTAFIRRLRVLYPHATIILATTILNHHPNWDEAIDRVCQTLGDKRVYHFLYSNNGCGTPGHIRRPEAEKMAEELSTFIESLGEEIWEDVK